MALDAGLHDGRVMTAFTSRCASNTRPISIPGSTNIGSFLVPIATPMSNGFLDLSILLAGVGWGDDTHDAHHLQNLWVNGRSLFPAVAKSKSPMPFRSLTRA
jgi:hypothetical protein